MNPVAKMLLEMARYYGEPLDKRQLELYVDVLSQFPQELVISCGRKYLMNTKNNRFPMPPHKIMEDHLPQEADNKDLARMTALRIREAVTRFGWPNGKEARDHLGEAAWSLVQRFGGWRYLCENLGQGISESTFMAQARDAAESHLNLDKAGYDPNQPAIEQSKAKTLIAEVAKTKALEGGTDGTSGDT